MLSCLATNFIRDALIAWRMASLTACFLQPWASPTICLMSRLMREEEMGPRPLQQWKAKGSKE
jgi:hypothetical protein